MSERRGDLNWESDKMRQRYAAQAPTRGTNTNSLFLMLFGLVICVLIMLNMGGLPISSNVVLGGGTLAALLIVGTWAQSSVTQGPAPTQPKFTEPPTPQQPTHSPLSPHQSTIYKRRVPHARSPFSPPSRAPVQARSPFSPPPRAPAHSPFAPATRGGYEASPQRQEGRYEPTALHPRAFPQREEAPHVPGALHPRADLRSMRAPEESARSMASPFRFQEQAAKAPVPAQGNRYYPVDDDRSDPECAEAFQTLVEREGIQDRVDGLAQAIRTWVAEHVIQYTVDLFQASDEEFEALAQELLQQGGASLSATEQELLKSTDSQEQKIEYMMAKCQSSPYPKARSAVVHRMSISKYLFCKGPPGSEICTKECKYALERIRELGKGYCLTDYKHNTVKAGYEKEKSQKGRGGPTREEYPVDARLVMHAVLTYLDVHCYSFINDYYQECPSRDAVCKKSVCIVQPRRSTDTPYYYLLIKRGGAEGEEEEWRTEPGQNNLFDALALLVYHVHEHCNGRLGNVQLDEIGNLDTLLDTLYTY